MNGFLLWYTFLISHIFHINATIELKGLKQKQSSVIIEPGYGWWKGFEQLKRLEYYVISIRCDTNT